jgi:peptide/nickel transport system permease protein
MGRYLTGRLIQILPVLVGVSVVVFVLVRLIPGDVVDIMIGVEGHISPAQRSQLMHDLGLDAPIYVQYARWLAAVGRGDLGRSLRTKQPVATILAQGLPVTLEVAALSMLLAAALAIPLGILTAQARNSRVDLCGRVLGMVGLSVPGFWLATLLMLFASRFLGWTPAIQFASLFADPVRNLQQMLLPALSLSPSLMVIIMRMTRSATLEVLGQDYIRVARAKGLAERVVLGRHALRNSLIPVITVMGIQVGYLLGGVVVIEQIFGLPGIGWMLLTALFQRDYPTIQPALLLLALTFIAMNLLTDLLYAYLDPRIRYV